MDTQLIEALKVALPYVERVAATAPTEPSRLHRRRQAAADAAMIRNLLAAVQS